MKPKVMSSLVFIFVIAMLFFAVTGGLGGMRQGADTIANGIPNGETVIYQDFTNEEWQLWMDGAVQYDVDVKINSNHAFEKHGSDIVNAALRCLGDKGTTAVISEKSNRNLHLLCANDKGEEFVIIITQIKKAVNSWSNATSELVTAFKLRTYLDVNIGAYIQRVVVDKGYGIIVRLAFKAGELFFSPY